VLKRFHLFFLKLTIYFVLTEKFLKPIKTIFWVWVYAWGTPPAAGCWHFIFIFTKIVKTMFALHITQKSNKTTKQNKNNTNKMIHRKTAKTTKNNKIAMTTMNSQLRENCRALFSCLSDFNYGRGWNAEWAAIKISMQFEGIVFRKNGGKCSIHNW